MSADPRRRLALVTLLAVHRGLSLAGALRRARSTVGDDHNGAMIEELVKGALQWQGRYDHLVRCFSSRRATSDPIVRGVLHLALHEMLHKDTVPDHAALHQAGELLRSLKRMRSVGYVNALLQSIRRHVAANGAITPLEALHDCFTDTASDRAHYLAAWWSHPLWLVRRWCARFGENATEALLKWANTLPPITLHALPGHDAEQTGDALARIGVPFECIVGFPRALRLAERLDRAQLRTVLGSIDGLLVQDAGAQDLVDWLTRDGADLATSSGPVVDLCAAPGGKASHLGALLPAKRLLIAMDIRQRRLALVRENRDRLQLGSMALLAGDAVRPPLRPACAGAVILDGPCSGTGVIRHHPEGRWRLRPETIEQNAQRLQRLAAAGADLLVDEGRLYYATCSLEPEENEGVIDALLRQRDDLEPDPDPDGQYERRWLPWRDGTDGFFAARLKRIRPRSGDRRCKDMS